MKKKTIKFSTFKYLLFLPILMFTYCESSFEGPALNSENKLTTDAKVLSLMKSAIKSDVNNNLTENKGDLSKGTSTEEDDQCTYFLYPMTFEVYSGDNPVPEIWEINSDEELISFIDTLVASITTYEFYIHFPITLLDSDGVETVLKDLTELEGTLQMAVEACAGFDDDSDDDGSDDGSDNDSNDGSDDGNNNGDDDDDDDDGSDDGSDNDNNDDYEYCDKNNKKVYICHKGNTICVSVNAIWGHMEHHNDDYLGSCNQ